MIGETTVFNADTESGRALRRLPWFGKEPKLGVKRKRLDECCGKKCKVRENSSTASMAFTVRCQVCGAWWELCESTASKLGHKKASKRLREILDGK